MQTMHRSRQILIGATIFIVLVAVAGGFLRRSIAAPVTPTPSVHPQAEAIQQVEESIQQAIRFQVESLPVFFLYENRVEDVRISADGNWAIAWLTPLDPDTGEVVPTEPGLVIAQKVRSEWQVYLPSDPGWLQALKELPEDLFPAEQKLIWMQEAELRPQLAPAAPLTGYRLPFPGGDTMTLTQSVGHDRYTPSGNAHFAFDFAKPGYPSGLFNIVAAKGGIVHRVRWTQANGSTAEPGNYIVLEDASTSPVSYQLYLHLAQDSIPPELRVIGAPVRRGQFIGIADDTGVSSGNHLHFMVHTNPASYWGTSVDITFEDVSINGGRPRITSDLAYCRSTDVCDTTQTTYTSANFLNPDSTPPIGNITAPITGALIPSSVLRVEGWAMDESSGLYNVQLLANYNGSWQSVGSPFTTNSFTFDWDWCASQVSDGPVSLALRIRDKALNQTSGLPGLTHVTKNFTCTPTPPSCAPSANQVALFSDKDFQGDCILLNAGSFTSPASLGTVGDDNAVSIQVGSNVKATLFMNANLQGRAETFTANDSNLGDNRIGKKTVSSVRVQTRTTTPAAPLLIWPTNGATLTAASLVSMSWQDAGGASQFQARLLRDGVQVQSTAWQSEVYWHISGLTPGNYTWQVKSRSGTTESAWSAARSFTISTSGAPPLAPALPAPFTDSMEADVAGWSNSGAWTLTTGVNHTEGGQKSWKYAPAPTNYDTGAPNAGYLTSPPISLPAGETYFLRFWYQYETESSEVHWDQRWVQISANGAPFVNVLQLFDDPPNYWLQSPAISLQQYAGQTIQVRFYFVTLDANLNAYRGWIVDDFSISATPPPACGDANDLPAQATDIAYGGTVNAVICPAGDVDYYRFQGEQGDLIGAWIEAQSKGSPLDSYLTLLDSDGRSVLTKNDDQAQYVRTDSWVTYSLPRNGIYYLKVQAWDHPSSGDDTYQYTLHLTKDHQDPVGAFIYPDVNGKVPLTRLTLRVFASDGQSGISRVRFQWHSADWENTGWITLGEDWDGSDGWSYTFDASQIANLYGGAFYARVFDWAGNWLGIGAWNLSPPNIYLPLIVKGR